MKRIIIFQVLIMIFGWLAWRFLGTSEGAMSFLSGGLVVTGNFVLLGLGWKMVFQKKMIALSVLIIVFKYAILGIIIYILVMQPWLSLVGFAAGVASITVASLIYGFTFGAFESSENGN